MVLNSLNLLKIGILLIIILLSTMIFHLVLGYLGFQYFFGTTIAVLLTILCIFFRFSLPLSIGTFFGIIYVLEWHWFFAILISLPGVIFFTPNKFKSTFNVNTFRQGYNFDTKKKYNKKNQTFKTNVKNSEIIDGEFEVINDEDKK